MQQVFGRFLGRRKGPEMGQKLRNFAGQRPNSVEGLYWGRGCRSDAGLPHWIGFALAGLAGRDHTVFFAADFTQSRSGQPPARARSIGLFTPFKSTSGGNYYKKLQTPNTKIQRSTKCQDPRCQVSLKLLSGGYGQERVGTGRGLPGLPGPRGPVGAFG